MFKIKVKIKNGECIIKNRPINPGYAANNFDYCLVGAFEESEFYDELSKEWQEFTAHLTYYRDYYDDGCMFPHFEFSKY